MKVIRCSTARQSFRLARYPRFELQIMIKNAGNVAFFFIFRIGILNHSKNYVGMVQSPIISGIEVGLKLPTQDEDLQLSSFDGRSMKRLQLFWSKNQAKSKMKNGFVFVSYLIFRTGIFVYFPNYVKTLCVPNIFAIRVGL